MSQTRLIALPCKISQGVVPDERAFDVTLLEGKSHVGVAPVHYFWNQNRETLAADEPSGEQEIDGWVAARLLDRQNGAALVSIPDGTVAKVASTSIVERPSEVVINVSVG